MCRKCVSNRKLIQTPGSLAGHYCVGLSNPIGTTLPTHPSSPTLTTVTITDDDDVPRIQLGAVPSITEGAGATSHTIHVPVTLIGATDTAAVTAGKAITVRWVLDGITATSPDDFSGPLTGTATIGISSGSTTIPIEIKGDNIDEIDKTFLITLDSPSNATLGTPSTTVVTIPDDDGTNPITLPGGKTGTTAGDSQLLQSFCETCANAMLYNSTVDLYYGNYELNSSYMLSEYSYSSFDLSSFGYLPIYESNTMGLVTFDVLYTVPITSSIPIPDQYRLDITVKNSGGTAIGTLPSVYYSTSGAALTTGDELIFSAQMNPASVPPTGYYTYDATVTGIYSSGATAANTFNGSTIIVNRRSSEHGAGWWMEGVDQVYKYSQGLALVKSDGSTAWFPGGSPDGEGDITYTTTLPGNYVSAKYDGGTGKITLLTKFNEEYVFDGTTGLLETRKDPAGNATLFEYHTGTSRIKKITDPFQRELTYAYDGSNKLTTVTDFAGRVVDITVNGSGQLSEINFPDPNGGSAPPAPEFDYDYYPATSTMYDGLLRYIETTVQNDPDSETTTLRRVTNIYDGSGHLSETRKPDYSGTNLARMQIESAQAIKLAYKVAGGSAGTSGSPTPVVRFEDLVAIRTDELGAISTYTFSAPDMAGTISRQMPLESPITTTFSRYPNGLIQHIDEHDPDGSGGGGPLGQPRTTLTYDDRGNVLTQTNPDGSVLTWEYDEHGPDDSSKFGVPRRFVDELDRETLYDVNATFGFVEKVTRTVDSTGEYDDIVTDYTYTEGDSGDYQDLPKGLLLTVTEDIGAFDANVRVVTELDYFFNDAELETFGRLASITRDAANGDATKRIIESFEYNSYGFLAAYEDGLGQRTEFTYDILGRVLETVQPYPNATDDDEDENLVVDDADLGFFKTAAWDLQSGGHEMSYFNLAHNDGAGGYAEWTFDDLVPGTSFEVFATWVDQASGAANAHFTTSGELQNLDAYADQTADSPDEGPFTDTTSWKYLGDVVVDGDSLTVRLDQHATGKVAADAVRLVRARPRTTLTYNTMGDVLTAKDPLGNITKFVYDVMSRPTKVTQPDPGAGAPVSSFTYDAAGNVHTVTDPVGAVMEYQYDAFGRVIKSLAPYPAAKGWAEVDDAAASITGAWSTSGSGRYATNGGGTKTVQWTFSSLDTNKPYEVLVTWDHDATYNSNSAPYIVNNGSTNTTVPVDQKVAPPAVPVLGGSWKSLGTFTPTGSTLTVSLSNSVVDRVFAGTVRVEPRPVTTYSYDNADNLNTVTDPLGNVTDYDYDIRHRLIEVTQPPSQGGGATPITKYAYYKDSQLRHVADPLGRTTRYFYNKWLPQLDEVRAPHASATAIQTKDESDASYPTGTWSSITTVAGTYNGDHKTSTSSNARAEWTLGSLTTGTSYEVFATWKAASGQATAAPTALISGGTTVASTVDQSQAPGDGDLFADGTLWQSLGVITVPSGQTSITVRVDGQTGTTVVADGIRLMPKASTTGYTYDQAFNLQTTTDPRGKVTDYDYDNFHRLKQRTDPVPGITNTAPVTVYTYDKAHNLTSIEDPEDNVTHFSYDALNRLIEEKITLTGPGDLTRTYNYDAVGNALRYTDRNGRMTNFLFDDLYRLTAENWLDDGGSVDRTLEYGYNAAGRLTSADDDVVDSHYTYVYNALGQVTSAASDNFNHTYSLASQYDRNARRASLAATVGVTADFKNDYVYDDLNRLKQITQQSNGGNGVAQKRVDFTYTLAGQFETITRYKDLGGTTTYDVAKSTFGYDRMGRLTELLHQDMEVVSSPTTIVDYDWVFDPAGRIEQFVSSVDGTRVYTYDDTNQLVAENDTGGSTNDRSYDYDENGNRDSTGYDTGEFNRIEASPTHAFAYDNEGNQVSRANKDNGVRELMEWDHRNRLSSITTQVPREVAHWRFDGDTQNATGNSDLDGTLVNGATYCSSVSCGDGPISATGGGDFLKLDGEDDYVSMGNKDELKIRDHDLSLSAWFFIDGTDFNRSMMILKQGNSPNAGGAGYRIIWRGDQSPANIEFLVNDGVNQGGSADVLRLWENYSGGTGIVGAWHHVAVTFTNSNGGAVKMYIDGAEVDSKSNTQFGDIVGTANFQVGNQGGVSPGYFERYIDDVRVWHEVLTPTDVTALYASTSPLYETAKTVDYDYDPFDRRIRKQIDNDGGGSVDETHEYVYDGQDIVLAVNESGVVKNRYLHGPAVDMILADEQISSPGSAGTTYWPLTDHLGTVRDLVDNNGSVVNHIQYDGFGNIINESGPSYNHIYGFTGREHDEESHLQFNRARYYDAAIGRWISEDPIGFAGGDENKYRYVHNRPIAVTDPSGLSDFSEMQKRMLGQIDELDKYAQHLPAGGGRFEAEMELARLRWMVMTIDEQLLQLIVNSVFSDLQARFAEHGIVVRIGIWNGDICFDATYSVEGTPFQWHVAGDDDKVKGGIQSNLGVIWPSIKKFDPKLGLYVEHDPKRDEADQTNATLEGGITIGPGAKGAGPEARVEFKLQMSPDGKPNFFGPSLKFSF